MHMRYFHGWMRERSGCPPVLPVSIVTRDHISATTSSTLALTPIRVTALVVTVPVPARTAAAIRGCCKASRQRPVPATVTEAILALAGRPRAKRSMQAVIALVLGGLLEYLPLILDAVGLAVHIIVTAQSAVKSGCAEFVFFA